MSRIKKRELNCKNPWFIPSTVSCDRTLRNLIELGAFAAENSSLAVKIFIVGSAEAAEKLMSLTHECVGCLRGVGRSLRGLIRAWWDVDRVRVSPREGQLLGLSPPCVIRVNGESYQMIERQEELALGELSQERVASVRYECRSAQGSARLLVRLRGQRGPLQMTWVVGDQFSTLEEHQIEVLG